ncbi:MAG TPA: hypothetical protein PKL45_00920 [Bacteroidia bacterium]|nr:hypothetical protein [Bacteroidia bacterium]
MNIKGDLKFFFLLFLIVLAAYWQIIFMQATLKWDSLAQYLPTRLFVSECIRNGELPLWIPYMLSGYPIHADPQSGAWYPFVWIYSAFGQYNLYALQIEFFLHVLAAAFGMYVLIKYVFKNNVTAFASAMLYVLSGFFVGNAQHLTYIIAACWTPWFFYFFVIFLTAPSFSNLFAPAIIFYLLLTGAYPAFTIITCYVAIILFLYFVISNFNKDRRLTINLIKYGVLLMVFVMCMSAVVLASQYFLSDYYTRSKILTWIQMNDGSFAPQCLLSLLFPLSSAKGMTFYSTDISMSNIYAGVFYLVFLILSFFRKLARLEKLLFFMALFFMLCALGEYTPVRGWLGKLPMLGWFRFPALFRFYFLICTIPIVINTVMWCAGLQQKKLLLSLAALALWGYIIVAFIFSDDFVWVLINIDFYHWNSFINSLSFRQSYIINALIGILILTMFLAATFFYYPVKNNRWLKLLIILWFVDLILSVQANTPLTAYNSVSVKNLQKRIDRVINTRKIIPELIPVNNYSDSALKTISPVFNNLGVYYGVPSVHGFLTFTLTGYEKYVDHPFFSKSVLNNWAYLSGDVAFYTDSITLSQTKDASHKTLFFTNEDKAMINSYNLLNDTTSKVRVNNFSAHKMSFTVETKTNQMFTLMQQFYPGWKAAINGSETKISIANYLHVSVPVKPGKSEVVFSFNNKAIKNWFYVSATFFIAAIFWLLVFALKKVV